MKKKNWIWRLLLLIAGISLVFAAATTFEQAKGKAVIQGVRRIKRGQADAVALSNRVTRILTRNDAPSEHRIRQLMTSKGWDFVCYYGRSALYRNQKQEVLLRKTALLGGYCIYELMDDSYFKYMKSEIREVA